MRGKVRRDGTVLQAGIPRQEVEAHPVGRGSMILRAVVLRTYLDGDPAAADGQKRPYDQARATAQVECDVYLFRSPRRRVLLRVPVMQHGSGTVNVHGLWIPRPSTRSLDPAGRTDLDGIVGASPATPANPDALDGDHVLVQFIENDPEQPIVVGSYPHPRASWRAHRALGQQVLTRHQGTEARLDERGNVLIDTTGATLPDGETASADGKSGNITLKLKEAAQLLASKGTSFLGVLADGTVIASAGADGYVEFNRTHKVLTIVGPQGQFLTMSDTGVFCVEQSGHFWKMERGGPLQISAFADLVFSAQAAGIRIGDQALSHEIMSASGGTPTAANPAGGFIAPFLAFLTALKVAGLAAANSGSATEPVAIDLGKAIAGWCQALLDTAGVPPGKSWTVK